MKMIVRAESFEEYKKRSLARAKKLTRREKIEPELSITFESPLDMMEMLTVERMRLCQVARTKAFSVSGLAAELKRDPKSVRRDVAKLEQYGVVRTREEINPGHGRVKIVEPVAKRFELRASF
jgi:predicted transcriptional regulator